MPVLRFFALQVAIGFGIAALFLASLLLADPGGIGTLLRRRPLVCWPLLLFWLFIGLTFGAVQFAAALGLAAEEKPQGDDRGSLLADPALPWRGRSGALAALRPERLDHPAALPGAGIDRGLCGHLLGVVALGRGDRRFGVG